MNTTTPQHLAEARELILVVAKGAADIRLPIGETKICLCVCVCVCVFMCDYMFVCGLFVYFSRLALSLSALQTMAVFRFPCPSR